ncbi:hypothetical protein [Roseibium sp.]|uniref:hypothetical protein n=1 Tax=Roseibium sp. TaxID=1936156 RepID=UPI003B5066CD
MGYDEFHKRLDARNALLDRMGIENLSAKEGEEIAAKQGIGPLERIPKPHEFDPAKKPAWSLLMMFAWVMWRQMDSVRQFWREYRENTYRLHYRRNLREPGPDGSVVIRDRWSLKQDQPLGMEDLVLFEALEEGLPILSYEDAKREIISSFLNGDITATGTDKSTREIRDVPLAIWRVGDITLRGTGITFEPEVTHWPHSQGYEDISVSVRDVLRIWPLVAEDKTKEAAKLRLQNNGKAGRPEKRDWSQYDEFVQREVKEYGDPRNKGSSKYSSLRELSRVVQTMIEENEGGDVDNDGVYTHVARVVRKFFAAT